MKIKDVSFAESFRDEPSVKSWLPDNEKASDVCPEMTQFLKPLAGSMRLLSCSYNGSHRIASRAFDKEGVHTNATLWTSKVSVAPVAGDKDAVDLTLTFKLDEGSTLHAGVATAFDFANWNADNYVLIPAAVYNGNRNRIETRAYATGLNRADLYNKNLPLTTGELPQLSPDAGKPSKIELNTSNAATPAICFYDRATRRAFILLAEQETRMGDNGLMIEESPDRSGATLVVSAPGVRERKPEFIGFSNSPDRGVDWKAGDEATLRLRVYSFETPNIAGMLEKFMSVRKSITGPNHPRNLIPMSEVERLITRRIDSRFHDGKKFKFYCPENAAWISFGWVGGMMDTFPMLALGDDKHLERVASTFDFAIARAQGRAGYFYGALNSDGKVFGREGYDEHPEIVLTRKNGDVLFWMIKQFMLLKAQGRASAIKPAWEQSMKRLATAFVATWRKDGQWGNDLNADTGEVAIYNTTGGIMAVGGLLWRRRILMSQNILKWRRKPPIIITSAISSSADSPAALAPTSCRTPTRKPPPASLHRTLLFMRRRASRNGSICPAMPPIWSRPGPYPTTTGFPRLRNSVAWMPSLPALYGPARKTSTARRASALPPAIRFSKSSVQPATAATPT